MVALVGGYWRGWSEGILGFGRMDDSLRKTQYLWSFKYWFIYDFKKLGKISPSLGRVEGSIGFVIIINSDHPGNTQRFWLTENL